MSTNLYRISKWLIMTCVVGSFVVILATFALDGRYKGLIEHHIFQPDPKPSLKSLEQSREFVLQVHKWAWLVFFWGIPAALCVYSYGRHDCSPYFSLFFGKIERHEHVPGVLKRTILCCRVLWFSFLWPTGFYLLMASNRKGEPGIETFAVLGWCMAPVVFTAGAGVLAFLPIAITQVLISDARSGRTLEPERSGDQLVQSGPFAHQIAGTIFYQWRYRERSREPAVYRAECLRFAWTAAIYGALVTISLAAIGWVVLAQG